MKYRNMVRKYAAKVSAVSAAALLPAVSFAATQTRQEAIQAAIDAGQSDYSLVTTAVITIAALGFCVGMIVAWMRK